MRASAHRQSKFANLVFALGLSALFAGMASAQDSAPPLAQASAESAAASVEVAATLGSGAVIIGPSASVLIAGSGATLVTGDVRYSQSGAELAEEMLSLSFDGQPLDISDEVLLADDMPVIPRHTQP
ncbi:MAG: hypothetical protein GYB36_07430 [Alphaproteobacteria bacterium]|nr:hypothetical protein [Alphaproteobacteria bacterium]